MIQNTILAITLVVAFLLSISAFILGVKIGFQLKEGKLPTLDINPVKKVIKAVETHKAEKEAEETVSEIEDVMSASKESMLKAIKNEVK